MTLKRHADLKSFADAALGVLLENEAQNNLPLSFIKNERGWDASGWLLSTVHDGQGGVVLTAACTPPHNIVLYETRNKPDHAAVKLLAGELKSAGVSLPGVLAEQGLARRFAEQYAERFHRKSSLNIMRLDAPRDVPRAPGFHRDFCEGDLSYIPSWMTAFGEDCNIPVNADVEMFRPRIGQNRHWIWEDGRPVSCAAHVRSSENGAGIGFVYTPPQHRGRGYATSVVAALSRSLLDRGNQFCFLYANAENPVSCGVYRKIGFYGICVHDEITFR